MDISNTVAWQLLCQSLQSQASLIADQPGMRRFAELIASEVQQFISTNTVTPETNMTEINSRKDRLLLKIRLISFAKETAQTRPGAADRIFQLTLDFAQSHSVNADLYAACQQFQLKLSEISLLTH